MSDVAVVAFGVLVVTIFVLLMRLSYLFGMIKGGSNVVHKLREDYKVTARRKR